jgi:hypothetical protein
MRTAQVLIRDDTRVAHAFRAMRDRGLPKDAVEVEIALALVCCIWETSRGLPDRFAQVCEGLAGALTIEQLFPDSLRDSRQTLRGYHHSAGRSA